VLSFGTISLQDKQNVIKIGISMPDILLNIKMKNYIRHFKNELLRFYDVVNEHFAKKEDRIFAFMNK